MMPSNEVRQKKAIQKLKILHSKKEIMRSKSTNDHIKKLSPFRNGKIESLIARTKPVMFIKSRNLSELSREWEESVKQNNTKRSQFQDYLDDLAHKFHSDRIQLYSKEAVYHLPCFKRTHFKLFTNIKRLYSTFVFALNVTFVKHPLKECTYGSITSIDSICYLFSQNSNVFSIDTKNKIWKKHDTLCTRTGHASVSYNGQAVVFGGCLQKADCLAFYKYEIIYKHLPYVAYRKYHSMAIIGIGFIRVVFFISLEEWMLIIRC